ncbi:hypothetical protein [Catellatospora methionotrophica]|uniref:hypothetical protein n=1 Tax=Catellatospora methionotrophica TaxID=121620 RepID=UPI003402EDB7
MPSTRSATRGRRRKSSAVCQKDRLTGLTELLAAVPWLSVLPASLLEALDIASLLCLKVRSAGPIELAVPKLRTCTGSYFPEWLLDVAGVRSRHWSGRRDELPALGVDAGGWRSWLSSWA